MSSDVTYLGDVDTLYFYFVALQHCAKLGLWCEPLVDAYRAEARLLMQAGYRVQLELGSRSRADVRSLRVTAPGGERPSVSVHGVQVIETVDRHLSARPPTAIPRPLDKPRGCEYSL